MSKVPDEPLEDFEVIDPLEFYVAALILWAKDKKITTDQAHTQVIEYLDKWTIDVDLDFDFSWTRQLSSDKDEEETLH